MAEKDWEQSKLRPDAMDEHLEGQHGRKIADLLGQLGEGIDVLSKVIYCFPPERQGHALISSIVGLLYPNDKTTCFKLLDNAKEHIERKVK